MAHDRGQHHLSGAVLAGVAGRGGDITPDALNWANITGSTAGGNVNADQTISGITVPIYLRASWTDTSHLTLYFVKNGGAPSLMTLNANFGPFWNGDTVHFYTGSGSVSSTVTIQNGNNPVGSIDTFTVVQ